ncbi:tail fiber protein [Aeromonas phage 51]|uniref:Tail fiber protein n=1 Tax=Aeromonas phage 51 TaxID=1932901 RepID=A0A219YBC2_9CAUD|nr:tail fiber protein [Aeromonas phage 51]
MKKWMGKMSISEPSKITVPFAESGIKNAIPQEANNATGKAGFDKGFPGRTMLPKASGGIPPSGVDFNGILYDITSAIRYMQAGGIPSYDAAFAAAISGYAKGAVLIGGDGVTLYQNTVDGNATDPNSGGAGWIAGGSSGYPVGAPIPWPTAVPPAGFIAMTGQSFSAATYPKLAQAYPSLVLPDMRAEFIRGWDNARGVDTGRVILSAQGDAIRNITGTLTNVYTENPNITVGALSFAGSGSASLGTGGTTVLFRNALLNASAVVPTAADNRPRNIAYNYIVRAA